MISCGTKDYTDKDFFKENHTGFVLFLDKSQFMATVRQSATLLKTQPRGNRQKNVKLYTKQIKGL